jgi:NAD(P)-dependent dehydrogenase (short-subunit alcohol dehydrogenase family)
MTDPLATNNSRRSAGNGDFHTALVTGATSGIGQATALALAKQGLHVLVSGRDAERAQETCAAIAAAGGRATPLLADLADRSAVTELGRKALEIADGRIDVLVNNAGGGIFKPTAEMTHDDFDWVFDLNARAPFFLTGALAPSMVKRGAGVIVSMSAVSAQVGRQGLAAFAAAKAALEAMTRAWAAEYGPHGVRVNTIVVGAIMTPINLHIREWVTKEIADIPSPWMAEPEEVASVVAFLASPAASYINGVALPVDGGFLSR